jgi:hypothetical protein
VIPEEVLLVVNAFCQFLGIEEDLTRLMDPPSQFVQVTRATDSPYSFGVMQHPAGSIGLRISTKELRVDCLFERGQFTIDGQRVCPTKIVEVIADRAAFLKEEELAFSP